MSTRAAFARAGTAALAAVLALGAGAQVQAQPVGSYTAQSPKGYYYDPCRRDSAQRGTAGALIGGGMGAVIGSNAAARNARTEGAILGGLLGALAGGMVGNKTAACQSQPAYNSAPPPPRADAGSYYDRDAYADRASADARYDTQADRYRTSQQPPQAEDCTLAESPIYMPDGRTQTRFVRVCRDANGKYAVVD